MVPHPFRNRVLQLLVSAMFRLLTKKHGAVTSSPGDQLTGNSLAPSRSHKAHSWVDRRVPI